MIQVTEQHSRQVAEQVLESNETRVEQVCVDLWETGPPRVVARTVWRLQYKQRCYNVPRQVCSTDQCQSVGGCGGSSVCSANDYTYRERCARPVPMGQGSCVVSGGCARQTGGTPQMAGVSPQMTGGSPQMTGGARQMTAGAQQMSGGGSVCQRVREASCYGSLGSCEAPEQTCCQTTYQRVCQQVPIRVPMMVNITIPGERIRKPNCSDVERTFPIYRTQMKTVIENRTREKCQPEKAQKCENFTLPVFETVRVNMSDRVELDSVKCYKQNRTRTHCQTFPGAKVTCHSIQATRRYIVNRVRCDQQRRSNICKTILWSRCIPNSGQECRMVQKTRCVPNCNMNPMCQKCDRMRQSGLLERPCSNPSPSSSCSKYYSRDTAVTLPGMLPNAATLFSQPTGGQFEPGQDIREIGDGFPEVGSEHASQMY